LILSFKEAKEKHAALDMYISKLYFFLEHIQ